MNYNTDLPGGNQATKAKGEKNNNVLCYAQFT
jgi:hypothetical protein